MVELTVNTFSLVLLKLLMCDYLVSNALDLKE